MRVIRRRIRGFFALEAILLFVAVIIGLAHKTHAATPLHHFGLLAIYLVLGIVFAMAWATTRKASEYSNPWAVAASIVSLAIGAYLLWSNHANLTVAMPGLIALTVGGAGLYFYGQGGTAPLPGASAAGAAPSQIAAANSPDSAPAKARPAPIAGDRTSPWVNRVFTVLSLAAQFGCVFAWSVWSRRHNLQHSGRLPWFILFTVAVLASTIMHELGHALVAWGFEMKLLSFNAGPFTWRKRAGEWHFKFTLAGFDNLGGAVRVVPTDPRQPWIHDLWMIAAGPLSNLLFGTIALVFVLKADWPYYEQTWRLVAFFASFCFIAAVTNLLPFRTEDGGYSDGARLLQILTGSPIEDYHRTMAALASTRVSPRRYRDLDIAALERAAEHIPQDASRFHLQLCASNFYLDSGRLPEAIAALGRAETIYRTGDLEVSGPRHTTLIFGHAYLNRDAEAARLWWNRMEAKGTSQPNFDYRLAQTALLWIEGRQDEAESAWRIADAEAFTLPDCGSGDFDRDRCALLFEALNSTVPVAAPPPIRATAPARTLPRTVSPQPPVPVLSPLPSAQAAPEPALQRVPSEASLPAFALDRIARIAAPASSPIGPAPESVAVVASAQVAAGVQPEPLPEDVFEHPAQPPLELQPEPAPQHWSFSVAAPQDFEALAPLAPARASLSPVPPAEDHSDVQDQLPWRTVQAPMFTATPTRFMADIPAVSSALARIAEEAAARQPLPQLPVPPAAETLQPSPEALSSTPAPDFALPLEVLPPAPATAADVPPLPLVLPERQVAAAAKATTQLPWKTAQTPTPKLPVVERPARRPATTATSVRIPANPEQAAYKPTTFDPLQFLRNPNTLDRA